MAFEIVYSPRAMRDLARIENYLAERSPTGMRNVLAAIKRTIDRLSVYPRIGTVIDDNGRFRIAVSRYPYFIFYRVADQEVLILHVRHGSRRPVDPNDL